ncbi:NADPH-dependent FMN reductase [Micromonospora fluostatini]|uniref:NADPH-dependent FMN reductase n=1 Tax=Micromonospora sp. JCM 30529 TaxID=3421643 RepID=UPI003D17B4A9
MSDQPVKVAVIVGSTRVGRFAPTVSTWFVREAATRNDVAVTVVDLADVDLPATLDASATRTATDLARMRAQLAEAEAFVVVTPEYNHSYPAPLKNAVDWFYDEWQTKPVAFVSYGGVSGGLRAVEHLRAVFAEVHATTIRDTVSFHGASRLFDEHGLPVERDDCTAAAHVLLDRLVWWARALSEGRAARPYKV